MLGLDKLFQRKTLIVVLSTLFLLIIGISGYLLLMPSDFFTNYSKGIKKQTITVDKEIEGKGTAKLKENTLLLQDFFVPIPNESSASPNFLRLNINLAVATKAELEKLKGDVAGVRKIIFQFLVEKILRNKQLLNNSEELQNQLLVILNEQQKSVKITFLNIEKLTIL